MPGKIEDTDKRGDAQDIEPAANTGEVIIHPAVRVFRRSPFGKASAAAALRDDPGLAFESLDAYIADCIRRAKS